MTDNQDKINQLLKKLETLQEKQNDFSREINSLSDEINRLKTSEVKTTSEKEEIKKEDSLTNTVSEIVKEETTVEHTTAQQQTITEPLKYSAPKANTPPKIKKDLEKFIGENLINKIGIGITIIGVAIGAKYSIEHDLISPLTRIILGYLAGVGLLGFGIKLKRKYKSYSAVLVGGAIAIMYFMTYAAYSFYDLVPQFFAFALMVIFTAFTVVAAINYNKQVIAHIGLVGAYAVPFLLSDGSGKVAILYTYMAIINVGILIISFKKHWKSLYYSSFGLTWFIFFLWYVSKYQTDEHFGLALTFLSIFFATFYLTFLAYKILQKEKFDIGDILLLLANSFIFYGFGYAILNTHETGEQLLGVFTLCNAIVHFIVSAIIFRQKLADKNLFFLVSGLVLVFITIAVPVQLDGNWVTLLWAGEAALLFWIGRTKNVSIYEKLSYPLMILAFFSIVHDWDTIYGNYYPENPESRVLPFLNINFLTSLLFILAFGFISFLNRNKNYQPALNPEKWTSKIVSYLIPGILIYTLYYSFRIEIANYWDQLFMDSILNVTSEGQQYPNNYWNYDLSDFESIWIINYSLLFVSILSFVNLKKLKNQPLGLMNLGLNTLAIVVFLTQGLYVLSELRESYLEQTLSEYYQRGIFNIGIRYVSFVFFILTLVSCYQYVHQEFIKKNLKIAFDFLLHISVLWIISSELINWLDIAGSTQSYKLGLSILWGSYSLFLIAFGIWKKKKHLRIGAISLFGVTLIKLFFYDISHLDTISKTIVFVSLGILLLIISFLYNKYKHFISNENNS
ncbi:DUF2339 domain-containing protein [Flagellimonas sp. CMM7]|uniref:DUF2339 domain-containing protein n=1 Tax=Flagellimonas sp. CMM7 TaxID=2654676 RepID=UPI0013D57B1D|nr:DUF2339 domain-containing protein [Flagellimonas sp. CMM7]UII79454.1 DUF2339 domain-containing protein [Flagellimonas sp. CMM7]